MNSLDATKALYNLKQKIGDINHPNVGQYDCMPMVIALQTGADLSHQNLVDLCIYDKDDDFVISNCSNCPLCLRSQVDLKEVINELKLEKMIDGES